MPEKLVRIREGARPWVRTGGVLTCLLGLTGLGLDLWAVIDGRRLTSGWVGLSQHVLLLGLGGLMLRSARTGIDWFATLYQHGPDDPAP